MIQKIVLLTILAVFAYQDWKTQKISVYMLLASGIMGLFCHLCSRQLAMGELLLGAAVGIGMLGIGFLTREKIGYGDGALVAVCGIFLGFTENLEVLCIALILLELTALFLVVVRKKGRRYRIPFCPFLLAGYLVILL